MELTPRPLSTRRTMKEPGQCRNNPPAIVGLGEVLWDLLPTGQQLGGAPANFTYHARALGAEARLISRVGQDALGRETLEHLAKLGVATECVEIDAQLPTGTVGVEIAADGQPNYQIHENVAWDAICGEAAGRRAVAMADAVCFGSLAQRDDRSGATIRSLVAASPARALRVFDINLRQHYHSREVIENSLLLANVLKANDAELPVLAALFNLAGNTRAQLACLAERFSLQLTVLTRGARGSLLFDGRNWSEHPGLAVTVQDTIGAGDAFTAATVLGFLSGRSLDGINAFANKVAAFVCSQSGATPPLPESLRAEGCSSSER